ncbi:hypothetical protein EUX98_g4980 [Antrodiella citrinella]|uniref:Uncharacterized protein n=1 Tax=Antrodiella citrinella TaxID=2447956 RepID=A0A4V3XIH2_9APHY|nr:hypothetical protein EUX98_g4980 [Antrodiella citrinella]
MSLVGSALGCAHFLDHCTVPASARISLSFQELCTPSDIPLIMPAISTNFSTPIVHDDKEPVETLSIRVAFFKRGLSAPDRSHAHLSISTYSSLVERGSMLAGLCSLPIREVPYLLVARRAWLVLFKAMVNIISLSMTSTPPFPSDIISLLQTRIDSTDSQKEKPIMAKLRRLLLQNVRFRDTYDDTDDAFVANLCAALTARRKGGRKLEKLHIEKCINMDEEDVAILEKVVEVVWDGVVEFEKDQDQEEEEDVYMEEEYSSDP